MFRLPMTCREALSLIATERDAPLETHTCSRLEAHLADCKACRQARTSLSAAIALWRSGAAQVAIPDAGREWLTLRRRIRGADAGAEFAAPSRRRRFATLALPLGAAGLLAAVAVLLLPRPAPHASPAVTVNLGVARAEAIEVPGGNASTMVFIDDKSGWLIVWASESATLKSI